MQKQKVLIVPLILLTLVVTACSSTTTPVASSSSPTPALCNGLIKSVRVVTQTGDFHTPLDSTPDYEGSNIYFTATGSHGPGVFRVPSAGGAATEVYTGSPFVAPRGIAFSPDGQHLYVTDPSAGTGGEIFMVPVTGGTPLPVHGSAKTAPQNLEVVNQGGQQEIFFTGQNPSGGQPAVFKLAASGATAPIVVAQGSPLVTPDGVVVTRSGIIYVSDRSAAGGGIGKVFKIDGSMVTAIIDQVRTGNPAGIALTEDESLLLVSALQLNSPHDQVLVVDLSTGQTGLVTKVISANHSGGGLHGCPCAEQQASLMLPSTASIASSILYRPAQEKAEFAWADRSGGGRGYVYAIML